MKSFTRAGVFAGAIALSTLGSASLHSSTDSTEAKTYLLKVNNVFQAAELVESLGGNVVDTAASISFVGATLTESQLQLLSRSDLVVRISMHEDIATDMLSDASEAPEGEAVAGFIWKY